MKAPTLRHGLSLGREEKGKAKLTHAVHESNPRTSELLHRLQNLISRVHSETSLQHDQAVREEETASGDGQPSTEAMDRGRR